MVAEREFMRTTSFILFATLLLMLARCRAEPSGGIVDNGNTPEDSEKVSDDSKGKDSPASISIDDFVVLDEFLVTAPSLKWKAENKTDRTTLSYMESSVAFTRNGDRACESTREVNPYSIVIHWCESGGAILEVGEKRYIFAYFTSRTSEIDAIVLSFRRK